MFYELPKAISDKSGPWTPPWSWIKFFKRLSHEYPLPIEFVYFCSQLQVFAWAGFQ